MLETKSNQMIVSTKFTDIDMMQVVHHSKYWIWFEEARFDFFNRVLDVSVSQIRESRILMPVIDCDCRYISTILWDQQVFIETRLELSNAPYFNFFYEIHSVSNSKLLSKGRTKQAFIDKNFNLKLKMPQYLSEAITRGFENKPYAFITNE